MKSMFCNSIQINVSLLKRAESTRVYKQQSVPKAYKFQYYKVSFVDKTNRIKSAPRHGDF